MADAATDSLIIWEAYTNTDLTEGRGSRQHLGFFTTRDEAMAAAAGQGVMGSNAYVEQRQVHSSFDEWAKSLPDGSHVKSVAFRHLRAQFERLRVLFGEVSDG